MNKYEVIKQLIRKISNLIGHRSCFVCHQSSLLLVCECCLWETQLPLFPVPGHNLLDHPKIYDNLVPPAYESLITLGEYDGVLKGLINQLKFSSKPLAAEVLAEFFAFYLGPRMRVQQSIPDALVPIPLSNRRHVSRQYNQARLLSCALASHFGIESIDGLKRTKYTQQQSTLDREDRQRNIQHAFAINEPFNLESIAIVDDVITTGATVNEACTTIQQAYPNISISVWCIAATLH
ncbi:MAG: ComF family protein [Alphaproteobacteria bacterium]|jgi:ComF family protein